MKNERTWLAGLVNAGRWTRAVLIGLSISTACSMVLPLSASADPVENAPAPPAQVKGLGNTEVELQNGAFTQDIPIETPELHGVTPRLSLH
jgi:hypothetical protein